MDQSTDPTDASAPGLVTVYWRRGCPYCASLRRGLRRAGLPTSEVDIWAEPAARGFVRSVANGNETVPTVVVGSVALVNPSVRQVLDLVLTELPAMAIEPPARRSLLGRFRRSR